MAIDPSHILIDAKMLMEHGKLHASHKKMSKIDRRLAVQHVHHAIELVLRAKAEDLNENPHDFPTAINILKKHAVAIPYEREIQELNKVRVLTQHYGTAPDEKDAYRLVSMAENFMQDFCKTAFEVDYSNISLIQLIENSDIRQTLDEAKKAYEGEKYEEAAINAHLAIQKAIWTIKEKMLGSRSHGLITYGTGGYPQDRIILEIEGEIYGILSDLDSISEIVLAAPFALDIVNLKKITRVKFSKFRNEISSVKLSRPKSPVDGTVEEPKPIQKEDAEFALELAIEYVLWAEQMYGL
jgi:hypothetical protein